MAVDPNNQSYALYAGEDVTVVLTGTDATDPTGWAMIATVAEAPGVIPPEASTTSVTVGGPTAGKYTLSFTFTRAQTLLWPETLIAWDIWRTDSGYNLRLAGGSFTVLPCARDNE